MKKILYFLIFSSFLGAKVFSIEMAGFQMSLFRLSFIFLMLLTLVQKKQNFLIYKRNNRYSILFMSFWVLYSIVSLIWSIDLSGWFRILYFLFIGIGLMIVFNNLLKTKSDIIQAFHTFQWGLIVQSIIGWYEVFTKDYHFIEVNEAFIRIYINSSSRIPIAMTGNPNNFATLMFIGIFASYICSKTSENKLLKWFHIFALISDILLVFLTTSRANILGVVVAVVFLLFISKKTRLFFSLYFITVILMAPHIISMLSEKIVFSSAAVLNSNSIRLNLIKNGFAFLVDTCGIGVGNGQIGAWMKSSKAIHFTEGISDMHNWWMEILAAYGIVIFIGYLIFYFLIFKRCYVNYKITVDLKDKAMSISICTILVGYTIASISSSSNMINESIWVFWAICVAYQGFLLKNNLRKY